MAKRSRAVRLRLATPSPPGGVTNPWAPQIKLAGPYFMGMVIRSRGLPLGLRSIEDLHFLHNRPYLADGIVLRGS